MMTTQKKSAYYSSLDAWRALASLCVVMTHSCLFVIIGRFPNLIANPIFAFSMFGSLGVQLFFVISGYCISQTVCSQIGRSNAILNFAKARIRRMYPPYIFSCTLVVVLAILQLGIAKLAHISGGHFYETLKLHSFLFYFANFTLTQIPLQTGLLVVPSWSLNYEIFFYLIAGMFLLWGTHPKFTPRVFLNGQHIITILTMCFLIAAPQKVIFPFNLWAQYGLGVLAYDLVNYSNEYVSKIFAIIVSIQVGIFIFGYDYGKVPPTHKSSREQFATAIIFALLLVLLHRFDVQISQSKPGRFLGWIGQFSYSIYLVHPSIIGLVYQIANKLKFTERTYVFVFFAEILISVACARLFYCFFERPFIKSRSAGTQIPSVTVVMSTAIPEQASVIE